MALVLYQAGTATNSHIGRQPLKIEQRTETEPVTGTVITDEEDKEINFVIPDQDQENERLVLQRDTERTVAANLKKPSNYRDGFTCDLVIEANKLKKLDCEGNSVFERSVRLALEKAKLNEFQTSVKHKFSIQIKV